MMRTQREMKGQRSDVNLRVVEQERKLKRQRKEGLWKEVLWKAVFLLLKSTSVTQLLRQKKREIKTKGMRRPFLLISRP